MKKTKAANTCIRAIRDEQQILRCKEQIKQIEVVLPNMAQLLSLAGNEVRLKLSLIHI